MHAFELSKVISVYAHHAETQLVLRCRPSRSTAHAYWLTNRYRLEFWSNRIAAHRAAIQRPGVSYRNKCWQEIIPVLQEVLLSELVTRCVAYHAITLEETEIDFDFAPLAQSVFANHLEARNRCLHLIVFGAGLSVELAVGLNRLRRSIETYSDELLAMMRPTPAVEQLYFDPLTSIASQQQLQSSSSTACRRLLSAASLERFSRSSAPDIDSRTAGGSLNKRLSQVLMELLPGPLFDSFGLPLSPEMARTTIDSSESCATHHGCTKPLHSPLDILHTTDRPQLVEPSDRRW